MDKPSGGVTALYNLGYRPSWESPILRDEKYEVKFFMPNSTPITFITGPNGAFSVFSLWLNMRILCAENDGKRSLGDTVPKDDIFNNFFNSNMNQPKPTPTSH